MRRTLVSAIFLLLGSMLAFGQSDAAKDARDLHQDRRDIRHDRRDIRHDRRDIPKIAWNGTRNAAISATTKPTSPKIGVKCAKT